MKDSQFLNALGKRISLQKISRTYRGARFGTDECFCSNNLQSRAGAQDHPTGESGKTQRRTPNQYRLFVDEKWVWRQSLQLSGKSVSVVARTAKRHGADHRLILQNRILTAQLSPPEPLVLRLTVDNELKCVMS